jgi:hypothetical protein
MASGSPIGTFVAKEQRTKVHGVGQAKPRGYDLLEGHLWRMLISGLSALAASPISKSGTEGARR